MDIMRTKTDKRTIEYVGTSSLTPYARNSRTHSPQQVKQIAASIKEFGFTNPVLIDEANGIIAGHGRVMAADHLQLAEVPCIRLSYLTETQKRAYVIADNKLALNAGWDEELLNIELTDLHDDGFDVGTIGFEADELSDLMGYNDKEVVEDEVPEPPAEPITKPGDLWVLGEHRLLCGDSTKAEDVDRLMAGGKADLCFTSPPYGAGNVAKLRDHYVRGAVQRESFYDQHEDDPESWPSLMAGWYDAFRPVSECVVCNVQMLADNKRALVAWLAERAADLCDVIVWDKINSAPQMAANVLSNAFEFCFVFGGNASRAIPFADFHGTLSNMLRLDPKGKNDQADKHRAVFPVELPAWFIQTLCKKARSVVDPFCGTGTTLIAAEQLGRKCYGMEISPAYCDVIVKRWETLTGKKAVLANG